MIKKISNSLIQFSHLTFSSLKIRNYRLYFIGQAISVSGTFMQSVTQAWLVLKLTNSGTALGVVTALQYLPILLFGLWGGVIADRYHKRKLIYFTQSAFGLLALLLGILIVTGLVKLWMVGLLALIYGFVNVIDNPARQAFVIELVGKNELRNAVTLYTSVVNLSRVIGPVIAAFLIPTVGLAPCFIINGLSYIVVIIMIYKMKSSELHLVAPVTKSKGQLIEGINYIIKTPVLRTTLVLMAIIGTFTYEFQVSLAIMAQFTFHGAADSYAFLTAAFGFGSVIGGLILAGQKKNTPQMLNTVALIFGVSTLLTAFTPNLHWAMAMMFIVGIFSIFFISLGNTILQLECDPKMRGRVMSFWTIAFLGSTAIGGPIIGWIGEYFGSRWSLAVGGLAAIIAAFIGILTVRNTFKKTIVVTSETSNNNSQYLADEGKRI